MRRCACLNVLIHVESPRPYDNTAHYTKFGRALSAIAKVDAARNVDFHVALLGVGGIKPVHAQLLMCIVLKYDWKLWYCGNCGMFIHCSHANVPDSILVNAALLESSATVPPSDVSPVFGIVLQQRGEPIVNVLLEAPDDPQQLEVYNRLQKVVVTSMKDAEDAMNKRIEQFVEAQREQLQEFTTRAFQDKKLFWLRYVAATKGLCVPTAGPPLLPTLSPAAVDPTSSSASDSGSSSPATSSPATSYDAYKQRTPLSANNKLTTSGGAAAVSPAASDERSNLRTSSDPSESVLVVAVAPAAAVEPSTPPAATRKPRRVSGLSGQSRAVFDIEIGAPGVDDSDNLDVDSGGEEEDSADDEDDDASSDAAALAAQSKTGRVQRARADANASSRSPKTRAATGVAMSMPLAIPDFGGRQFGGRRGPGLGPSAVHRNLDDPPSDDDDDSAVSASLAAMARSFQAPLDGVDAGFDRPSFRDRAEYIQRTRKYTK